MDKAKAKQKEILFEAAQQIWSKAREEAKEIIEATYIPEILSGSGPETAELISAIQKKQGQSGETHIMWNKVTDSNFKQNQIKTFQENRDILDRLYNWVSLNQWRNKVP